jgi:hypothetical protein
VTDRKLFACIVLIAAVALGAPLLRADHAPYYLSDGSVVHGDWGLYRPGHVAPWVEGPYVVGAPRYGYGAFYPTNRNDPGAYRRRPPVDPVPIPAEPYFRSWGSESPRFLPSDATLYAPFGPPEVIYAPRGAWQGKNPTKK